MLVYAYSCRHAEALCQILRAYAPGLRVDWAGTGPNGRSEEDNERVKAEFLDKYEFDKRTRKMGVVGPHTLDVLVQVNMAAEGFNSRPVCVIVDLALTGFGPQKLQAYGRGTREYFGQQLTIFVPTDSNVAALVQQYGTEPHRIFDEPVDTVPPSSRCTCCAACPDCEHHPFDPIEIPDFDVFNATLIGGHDYEPTSEEVRGVAVSLVKQAGHQIVIDVEHNQTHYDMVSRAIADWQRITQQQQSEASRLKTLQSQVAAAVGTCAYNVNKLRNLGFTSLGELCKRINGRWKYEHCAHDAMMADEFEQKLQWLRKLNRAIIDGCCPPWLLQ
jgi:hypothetical protein